MKTAINIEILRKKPRVGGNQYVYHLVRGMDTILNDDELVLLNNSNKKGRETLPDLPEIHNNNIKYRNIRISKRILTPIQKVFGYPKLENITGGFDVYHEPAHSNLPYATNAAKVSTIHDLVPMKKGYVPDSYWEYMKDYFRMSVKWADVIITDSVYTKNDIIETLGVDQGRITVIPLAASFVFRPVEDKAALRNVYRKYGIEREFLLFVGTIEPRKNVVNIVKAYNEFRNASDKDGPALVLAGGATWATGEAENEIDKSPFRQDIFMTGYTPEDDLVFLMNAALCLVYPSIWEGFGLPILEAMACGTPVITSNVTSNPEVAGDAALLVSPGDVHLLSEYMSKVVHDSNLREELIRKGFDRSASFTWEKCASETLAVYKSLC